MMPSMEVWIARYAATLGTQVRRNNSKTINSAFIFTSRTCSKRTASTDQSFVCDEQPSLLNITSHSSSLPSTDPSTPFEEDYFLKQVQCTVSNVLQKYRNVADIFDLPLGPERESFQTAQRLHRRLLAVRNNNNNNNNNIINQDCCCPRCWLLRKYCICPRCPPILDSTIDGMDRLKRIFVVMHHKEVGLKVDTAKLILSTFPTKSRLVIGGIGPQYQASMKEMLESITDHKRQSLLLFPDESSKTLRDIINDGHDERRKATTNLDLTDDQHYYDGLDYQYDYDLIVLDGTWSQARKFHSKYFPAPDYDGRGDTNTQPPSLTTKRSTFHRVQLSEESVQALHTSGSVECGHQLRKHSIKWRQVGTFEATRLFLRDWCHVFCGGNEDNPSSEEENEMSKQNRNSMKVWETIEPYQRIANEAAAGKGSGR